MTYSQLLVSQRPEKVIEDGRPANSLLAVSQVSRRMHDIARHFLHHSITVPLFWNKSDYPQLALQQLLSPTGWR
ncbi:MAG: hypothetical protein Q9190_000030 [Brigantiaea leucoxantha]